MATALVRHSRLSGNGVLGSLVFLVCLIVYVPTASSTHVNTDAAANSLAAWRMAHTGLPWMDGLDLTEAGDVVHFAPGRDGHMVTTRTPGQIWAAVPFYLGSSGSQDEWWFTRGSLAAAFLTAGSVALLFLGLRRARVRLTLALGATAVFAFATPVWSVSANALWTHPVTLLGITGATWALARERWALAGVWLAVAMTGRVHVAIIAAVVGLGLAWAYRKPGIAVRVAVPTLATLGGLSAWNYFVFGSSHPRGGYQSHDVESLVPAVSQGGEGYVENLVGFLVSPDRGMLLWTPLLVVLLPALLRGWSGTPVWTRWLAAGGVAYTLAQLGLNPFHGGDAIYGQRLGLELLAAVTPLYVTAAAHAGTWARRAVPVIVGVQAGAFFLGSVVDTLSLPLTEVWRDNALTNALRQFPGTLGLVFVVVAAAVALATRRLLADAVQVDEGSEDVPRSHVECEDIALPAEADAVVVGRDHPGRADDAGEPLVVE